MSTTIDDLQLQDRRQRLASDVRGLVDGAEELLRSTASYTGDELQNARDKLGQQLSRAKVMYDDLQATARDTYRQASQQTDTYVHENPWKAVGIAAAVGVLVSLVALRR